MLFYHIVHSYFHTKLHVVRKCLKTSEVDDQAPPTMSIRAVAFAELLHTYHKGYILWPCQNCEALSYLLDDINIRFDNRSYRQIICIPMGTNCVPLVADLFLFATL